MNLLRLIWRGIRWVFTDDRTDEEIDENRAI